MNSRDLEEKLDENLNRRLARVLGIPYDDLLQTDFVIETDESDDGFIYGSIVKFLDSSPLKVLKKIEGIDDNNTVYLSPNALD